MTQTPLQPPITLDRWPHPLTTEGRETRLRPLSPATPTLAALIARERAVFNAAAPIAAVNGRVIPEADWAGVRLVGGEIVTLRARVSGGGDSDPLAVVLQIAVMAARFYIPGLPAFANLGSFGQMLVGAAVNLVGGLVVNAIAPPREAEAPGAAAQPEPVYSLSGGANRAREYAPQLLVLGRHRVFPDLGAREYTEFRGNEQYLHQLFHFGLGNLDVSDMHIGDSPLSQYESVETQWARGTKLTLVSGNVDTESGAALDSTAWVMRTTPDSTARLGIDLVGAIFKVNRETGDILGHSAGVQIEYWPEGEPLSKRSHSVTLSNNETTPYRRTLTYTLPAAGVYTVRVRRTSKPSDDEHIHDALTFAAMRSYQPDTADYAGQTRLGLRIRATGQLFGRLERLSALVKQKIPVWDGNRWTAPQASSNPAWVYRWYARGVLINAKLAAGAGLTPERIDEAAIKAWGAWCEAEALTCNFIIERKMSHAKVLTMIAQCGRASRSWQSGKLGVVWEARDKPVSALITPGNIIAGSFEVAWAASDKAADEIVCRYIEPDLDWQWHTVRRTVPGIAAPSGRSAMLTLPGVTSAKQAAKECNLQAARQRYHRRRLTFEMAAEGTAIARGDVVHLTHGLIDGGVAGRILSGTTSRLTLDRPVTLAGAIGYEGAGDYLLLRLADGALHTSAVTHPEAPSAGGETDAVILETPLPNAPDAKGADPLDTLWRFYARTAPPAKVRIVGVEPIDEGRIRFSAIDEVDAYHNAAVSGLEVSLPALNRRRARIEHIEITETLIRAGSGFAVQLNAALTVSGPWRGGSLRASLDGGEMRTVATLSGSETAAHWFSPPEGTLTITAIPGTEAAPLGMPLTIEYVIQGKLAPPGAYTNFLIDVLGDGTRRFRFTPPADPDLAGAQIRFAADSEAPIDWDDMTPMHAGLLTSSPWETVEPAPGRWVFAIRAVDTGGRLSGTDARIVASIGDQHLGDALLWACPAATGWPGTLDNALRSHDSQDALEGVGDYAWDDMLTWDDWGSWSLGDGDDGATSMRYTTEPIDLGLSLPFSLAWEAETTGEVAFEVRTADTAEPLATAAWGAYTEGDLLTTRYLELRWRLTGDGATLLRLDHLCYAINAPVAERKFLDVDTANWAGSAAGGRLVPVPSLSLVTDVHLTLQSVGPGWSWSLDSKNNPTRVKLFDADGDPADATVDAVIRGVA